jgi:hypothetical protein
LILDSGNLVLGNPVYGLWKFVLGKGELGPCCRGGIRAGVRRVFAKAKQSSVLVVRKYGELVVSDLVAVMSVMS